MVAVEGSPFTLDGQLCFALHSASRAITGCYRPLLDQIGLTYSQYLVMLALWETSPLTVSQLGEQLYLDSGTLSPLLKRLEGQGLVERSRRPEDERVLEVRLTTAGRRLKTRTRAVQAKVELQTGLSGAELAELRHQLQALAATLRGHQPPASAVS